MAFIGIDLGTTYSVVATLDSNGHPLTVPNAEGDLTTPSVVLYEPSGEVVVGREAKMAALALPQAVAFDVKRYMGDEYFPRELGGSLRSPVEISAEILKKLKRDAEAKLGPIEGCVITVPAYFDEARRFATVTAGERAGLHVLDVINEPTAAALAFAYKQLAESSAPGAAGVTGTAGAPGAPGAPGGLAAALARQRTILVYDLGGGTLDVTILRIEGATFRVLATDGDIRLGGRDWDEELAGLLAERFVAAFKDDPRSDPISHEALLRTAEDVKMNLSGRSQAHYVIHHGGQRQTGSITRKEFEDATLPLLYRTERRVTRALKAAGLGWNQIDQVIATGGSTRMPQVRAMLHRLSEKEPDTSLSPDEAVAAGAAIHAATRVANEAEAEKTAAQRGFLARFADRVLALIRSIRTTNVNAHSFGVVVTHRPGQHSIDHLIPRNTPLPVSVTKKFGTVTQDQRRVTVEVVEGESEELEHCMPIGICQIDSLPPGLPRNTPIEVTFTYDNSGRLSVKAYNPTTQRWASVTIDRKFGLGMRQMTPR